MNEIEIIRTPELIGAEIRTLTGQAKRMTLYYYIEIGRRLTEAKALCEHGEWLDFLKRETEFSQPTASRFMKAFEEYGAEQQSLFGAESKYSTLNNLSISNALKLLALPEEERESFAEEVDAEHISTRDLQRAIDEKLAAEKRAADAVKALSEAKEGEAIRVAELEEKLKELENRPVEVAVERDEKAIADARAEAEQAAAAKIAELTAQLSEAQFKEAEAKAAEKKAKEKLKQAKANTEEEAKKAAEAAIAEEHQKAADAEKEAEDLRAQLAEAQTRLKTADPDTAVFMKYFEEIQLSFNKLSELQTKIARGDQERGGKLRTAVLTALDQMRKKMEG